MISKAIRSPLFYVGDKYKLMPQLTKLIPTEIDKYIEPFVGGGSSFLNTQANSYWLNDIDTNIIELHKFLISFSNKKEVLIDELYRIIDKYKLSCSYRGICVPDDLKKKFVKTYYSQYNKQAYSQMRKDYNETKETALLYLLLIYGFNHMIRFNSSEIFNLPVGNVDFNKNVYEAIGAYLDFVLGKQVQFSNQDYQDFLEKMDIGEKDFVYLDPPYLISDSEYNKLWGTEEELRLLQLLDKLNEQGVIFGITNLVNHKDRKNEIFIEWAQKYFTYDIKSNYISFNDNTIKTDSREVYVTNAKRKI